MNMMFKKITALSLAALCAACATPQRDETYTQYSSTTNVQATSTAYVAIDFNASDHINGRIQTVNKGTTVGPMYGSAGGGLIGAFAELAAHSAIISAQNKQNMAAIKEGSDAIAGDMRELAQGFQLKGEPSDDIVFVESDFDTPLLIKSEPRFYFSQDYSSLSILHKITVSKKGSKKPVFSNLVELIEDISHQQDYYAYWHSNNGDTFKTLSKQLFQESLKLGISDFRGEIPKSGTVATHKFSYDGRPRVERGFSLEDTPNLIRNLRGWILRYPAQSEEYTAN